MNRETLTRDALLALMDEVKDPEVPVLSVVELGIVRDVAIADGAVVVTITPTYSGCPAMREIEQGIRGVLAAHDIERVELRTVYSPAWATEWIGPEARAKLAAYGIAPPNRGAGPELVTIRGRATSIECPRCGSRNTERQSEFGSTACKALWVCRACGEPFEEFKSL